MSQQPIDELNGRQYPALAAALRSRAAAIEQSWESLARQYVDAAESATQPQLRDDVPHLLAKMASLFENGHESWAQSLANISHRHGTIRFEQNYNLNQVLVEFSLLRRAVVEQITDELSRPLNADEAVALHLPLDAMARHSAVAFADHQTIQLRSAAEAHSKYLSLLSHDLRGGLNGILLMAEVLRRELAGDPRMSETASDLDMMRRSIHDTVGTMDRFLDAERFRKGKVTVRPAPLNLGSLLDEIGARFAYQARDKGLELRVDVPPGCSTVSDRELVTMIVSNLVANAVKYTPAGKVVIGAAPARDVTGWRVEVSDAGPGIARDKLAELFNSFTRGETHGQSGAGLGLSIARQAADLLGARLWAESVVGQGSTFCVEIPEAALTARPATA